MWETEWKTSTASGQCYWVTINSLHHKHYDKTVLVRESAIGNCNWLWSPSLCRWFLPSEIRTATDVEILKAKLLGE